MELTLDAMRRSVLEGDEDLAAELATRALGEEMDLLAVMNEGFLAGIGEAGRLYEAGDYFLPELVCSADAMKAALAVLDEALRQSSDGPVRTGSIVLATVHGDVHDIGKTIVGAMFTAAGYEVHDLGADVANEDILKAVRERQPEFLGLSALLTTTMEEQRNVIRRLEQEGLRHSVKVLVGGAPASRAWAESIGADGYADNGIAAVKTAASLLPVTLGKEAAPC